MIALCKTDDEDDGEYEMESNGECLNNLLNSVGNWLFIDP